MDNYALLLLAGAKKIKQTIGKAGQQGFGVGVYGGSLSDLRAIGLSPMEGCDDPASDNYGNYIHTNTSVMVFIPAFCYRIGNAAAPSYSRDRENALEIRDAALGEGDGWILHRAFIDGGKKKKGFFFDKYICSKDSTGTIAVSKRLGQQFVLDNSVGAPSSSDMPGCNGNLTDAFTLGRNRGEAYSCASVFQWSALAMLSLAHGQAATSTAYCAWYDPKYKTNFPKGCNNSNLGDYNDPSVSYSAHDGLDPSHSRYGQMGLTGSGKPFNKTTHNGQNCGIADVSGCMLQPLIGVYYNGDNLLVAKETYKMHDFIFETWIDRANYDTTDAFIQYSDRWGSTTGGSFSLDTAGANRAGCGVLPRSGGVSDSGLPLFGNDFAYTLGYSEDFILASGSCTNNKSAGIFYRYSKKWYGSYDDGLRIAGYAN